MPPWGFTVITVVVASVMSFLYWRAKQSPRPASRADSPYAPISECVVLRHSRFVAGLGWLSMTVVPAAIVLLMIFVDPPTKPGELAAAVALIGMFMCLGLPLVIESRLRILVDNQSIAASSSWTGYKVIEWKDIAEVRYSRTLQWFVIRDDRGTTIRVHGLVIGIKWFVEEIIARVPQDRRVHAKQGFTMILGRKDL